MREGPSSGGVEELVGQELWNGSWRTELGEWGSLAGREGHTPILLTGVACT